MLNPSHLQPQNTKSSQTDLATSIVIIVPATQNKLIATRSPPRTTLCVDYPSRFTRLSSNRHFSETQKHTKIYRIIVSISSWNKMCDKKTLLAHATTVTGDWANVPMRKAQDRNANVSVGSIAPAT